MTRLLRGHGPAPEFRTLLAALALLVAAPAAAAAHPAHPPEEEPAHEEEPGPSEEMPGPSEEMPGPSEEMPGHPDEVPEREEADLVLVVPASADPGQPVHLEATLRAADGTPVEGAEVVFVTVLSWGGWLDGEAVLGSAATDASGRASVTAELPGSGAVSVDARFAGDARLLPAAAATTVELTPSVQRYTPQVGIELPGVGGWWLAVLLAVVWGVFLLVALRVVAVAREGPVVVGDSGRRGFVTRFLAPAALVAAVAGLGSGLVALVTRSPQTHANLDPSGRWPERARHRLTPVAHVGTDAPTRRPLPALVEREVSFARDVMPILRAKGGPHAHPPKHSPAPHGVRLDSHAHLMQTPGLVVPGEPERSRLVTVLLDPTWQMPPSVPPLPDEEIALIATWVAQGAPDN